MPRIITYSTKFPVNHLKAGSPTHFVEKFWKSIKVSVPCSNHQDQLIHELNNLIFEESRGLNLIPKHHTIRKGNRWKKGDLFSPRIWGSDVNPKSGRSGPYHSTQIILAPDQVVTNVWDIEIIADSIGNIAIGIRTAFNNTIRELPLEVVAENDGLTVDELRSWFNVKPGKKFIGQIICWNSSVNY
jgi:hypothetical protein